MTYFRLREASLISEPFLQDAYFQRSVVLLVEHTQEGSMGFVLNKENRAIGQHFLCRFARISENAVYIGGPGQCKPFVFYPFLGRPDYSELP